MKRMFRTSLKIFCMISAVLMLSGCWDSLDIEKRNIVITLIVDKNNDDYYYYSEIANLSEKKSSKSENQSKSGFSILTSKGKNFITTKDEIELKSVNSLFFGAGRTLILTDRMSENGIEKYMNRIRGEIDIRNSILIATTSNEPMDGLNTVPENAASVGFAIESNLESNETNGSLITMSFGNVLKEMAVKKVGFLLPSIKVSDNKTSISGYTIFNSEAKSIGKIPVEKREGLVYLLNPKATSFYDISKGDNTYTIKSALKSKNIKATYSEGQLTFRIKFNIKANIEFPKKMELLDQETVDDIKNKIVENIKKEVEETIQVSQKQYGCDYLGFYRYYRAIDPKGFEKMDWSEVYSNAKVEVEPNIIVNQTEIPYKN